MRTCDRFWRTALALALLPLTLSACGGSSSETPPPLRPHALHAPYRAPRIVAPVGTARSAVTPEDVELEEESPRRQPAKGGRGSETWGSDAPPALPETEVK